MYCFETNYYHSIHLTEEKKSSEEFIPPWTSSSNDNAASDFFSKPTSSADKPSNSQFTRGFSSFVRRTSAKQNQNDTNKLKSRRQKSSVSLHIEVPSYQSSPAFQDSQCPSTLTANSQNFPKTPDLELSSQSSLSSNNLSPLIDIKLDEPAFPSLPTPVIPLRRCHLLDLPSVSSTNLSPCSPAAMFLSSFGDTIPKSPSLFSLSPDEEGQTIDDFIMGKVIGHGGFSTVRIATDRHDPSRKYAVKIVKKDPSRPIENEIQKLLEKEISIWQKLDHPNIVRLHKVVHTSHATYVFSEFCQNGTLLDYLSSYHCNGLCENEARRIFIQILETLHHLHTHNQILHRDIKLENILLDSSFNIKLCDFGLSQSIPTTKASKCPCQLESCDQCKAVGSLHYCSPEQLHGNAVPSTAMDVWSLGIVLYTLVCGHLPFQEDFPQLLASKIKTATCPALPSCLSSPLRTLLAGLLQPNPDHRLTLVQVLESDWCQP